MPAPRDSSGFPKLTGWSKVGSRGGRQPLEQGWGEAVLCLHLRPAPCHVVLVLLLHLCVSRLVSGSDRSLGLALLFSQPLKHVGIELLLPCELLEGWLLADSQLGLGSFGVGVELQDLLEGSLENKENVRTYNLVLKFLQKREEAS